MGRTNGSGDDSAAGGAGGKAIQQGHLDSAGFVVVADRKTTIPAARCGNGGGRLAPKISEQMQPWMSTIGNLCLRR